MTSALGRCATLCTGYVILQTILIPMVNANSIQKAEDLKSTKGFLDIPVRYKEIPDGICERTPRVKSFSGYVDVEPNQHIFWTIFEAREGNPEEAPLTVWLSGGPGGSSMDGREEVGPCGIDSNGDLFRRRYSWSNISNLLLIDQPVGVGFSYIDPLEDKDLTPNSTESAAPAFWKTLQGWMGAFPQYSQNGLNIATVSYGGHYGPVFARYIETQNDKIASGELSGAQHINLTSLLIGNGWIDPTLHAISWYNYTVSPGNPYNLQLINSSMAHKLHEGLFDPGQCLYQLKDCNNLQTDETCKASAEFCRDVQSISPEMSGRDDQDIRYLTPDPFPPAFYVDFLAQGWVRQALGAEVDYTDYSYFVEGRFDETGDDSRELGIKDALRDLVNRGVNVVLYHGDADYMVNWMGGEAVALALDIPGFSSAGYQDIITPDNVVHGQVKQINKFAFVRIYDAGHGATWYQPLLSQTMFERATKGLDIATGTQEATGEYRSIGEESSTFREGGRSVMDHVVAKNATYNHETNRPEEAQPTKSNSGQQRGTIPSMVSILIIALFCEHFERPR
ncbi:hypothetical protein PRZ48_005743 [Zasmidium cellare]|uniref:Serine carboxypeptidase n=1 Tax=Zasmidium cellare TaxID=395010 RepID=A0ABR0EMG4_ZASCE|nr:hypothetical protein PRZ48_005743 [Zasmidium cellare]